MESRINIFKLFKGLSYFEIAHYEHCKDVFVEIEGKGQKCTKALRKHPTHAEIAELRSDLKQIEDVHMPASRRGRPLNEEGSTNATFPDVCEAPIDRIDINTA